MPVYDVCVLLDGDTMTGTLSVPALVVPGTGTITLGGDAVLWRTAAGNLALGDDTPATCTLDLRGGASGTRSLGYWISAAEQWRMYMAPPTTSLFIRDMVNARQHVTYAPGSTSALALSTFNSGITVNGPVQCNSSMHGGTTLDVDGATTLTGAISRIGAAAVNLRIGTLATTDMWIDAAASTNANVNVMLRAKGTGLIQGQSPAIGFVPVVTKTADYTLVATDCVVLCNATMTATLPSAITATAGKQFTVKNIHASATVTLAATAGTIDSSATASIAAKGVARAVSDGANWWLI